MGALARAFNFSLARRSFSPENPAVDMSRWVQDWPNGGPSDTGMPITQTSSLRLSAVWRCVRVLSDDVASLPLFVMEAQKPRGSRKAIEHPLYDLLHLEPNPRHSSFTFRSVMQANVVLQGNAYAGIRRDAGGRIRELWPIPAPRVEPRVDENGVLYYMVRLSNESPEPWDAQDILHIPGLGFDGVKGLSVLAAAREGIGIGLAAQKYGATLFRRGGRVPGVIKTPFPTLDSEKRKNLREGWEQAVGGDANWHSPAMLPKGFEYQDIGIKPDEAQWVETKKFQVLEICRMFGVNPHKVFDYERATFTNFEQSSLGHIIDTLVPWIVSWEQEMNRKLLTPAERKQFYIAFSVQGLMRGDTQTRGQFYALGRQWGFFSANDVRELEDLPDLGKQGDIYMVPINMEPADQIATGAGGQPPSPIPGNPPTPPASSARPAAEAEQRAGRLRLRRKIRAAQRAIIEDRATVIVKRETASIERELKQHLRADGRGRRSLASLRQAINDFYDSHGAWAAQRMQPIILSYAGMVDVAVSQELGNDPKEEMPPELEKFAIEYVKRFGIREASESRFQLLALIDEAEAQGDAEVDKTVQTRLDQWNERRPGKIALNESVQFMAAAAKTLYILAGITIFRWKSSPGACDFCASLDGQVAGVHKWFVKAGEGVDGGPGAGAPLKPSDNIGHPPLHNGCECDVMAG